MTPPPAAKRRYAKRLPPDERRDQLLDAALELIVESGYGALTMHDVARRADVTRPVVYEQFAGRDELLTALLEREERRMQRAVTASIPTDTLTADADPMRVLEAATLGFLQAVRDAPGTWRLVYLPAEGTPASLRDDVEQSRRVIRGQLQMVLSWALHSRGIGNVDLELLAHVVQAFIERAAILVITEPDRYPPERIAQFVRSFFAAVSPA